MSSNRPDTGPDDGLSDSDRRRRALERRLREALTADQSPVPDNNDDAETPAHTPPASVRGDDIWDRLPRIPVEPARLDRNLVITASRHDPAHGAFDVLRTRIVQAMRERLEHPVFGYETVPDRLLPCLRRWHSDRHG